MHVCFIIYYYYLQGKLDQYKRQRDEGEILNKDQKVNETTLKINQIQSVSGYNLRSEPQSPIRASRCKINSLGSNLTHL